MRLELAIAETGVGGAEAVVTELARAAIELGDAVGVLAAPGPLDTVLSEIGVDRRPLPPPSRSPRHVVRSGAAAVGALRAARPDLIHTHNPRITGTVAMANRASYPFRRPPVLATFHGGSPAEMRAAARVMRLAERVVCVSTGLAAALRSAGMPPSKLSVIPNGVSPARPLTPERRAALDSELGLGESLVVSIVGRLARPKAHERFLAAAAIIADELKDVRFLIVGDGPRRTELERRARVLGLSQRVRFMGFRSDARDVIARSDLLLFSSDWEGLSVAALEGLAAGVPVVSTDVPGMSDLLTGGAGVIVSPDAEALAGQAVELLKRPERRAAMGGEGRRLYRARFSTERMVADYRDLYARLHRER